MAWAHDTEVTAIQCSYFSSVYSLSHSDDGRVDSAQREIVVGAHKLCHA